jgi:CspA family cold shock protein
MANGVVKFYKVEKGWGAVSSSDLPDGADAWIHFSAIEMDGFRTLAEEERVEFDYEEVQQDSFRFRVTRLRVL